MNFRTTYILFGGFGLVLAVVLLAQFIGRKTVDTSNYVLPSMHKPSMVRGEDIDRVEFKRPDGELVLVRGKHGWQTENPKQRVDPMAVDRLIGQIRDAAKEETADTRGSLSQFGLDAPESTVTLRHKDGRQWTINLGKVGLGGIEKGVVYVTSSDRPNEALAVKGLQLDHAFKKSNELRSRDLLTDSSTNMTYVRLDEPGKESVIIEQVADQNWRFQKPALDETDFAGETVPVGQESSKITGVDGLLKAIAKLKVDSDADFVEADAKDLAKYGLEEGKQEKLRIEIGRKTGGPLAGSTSENVHDTLLIGKKDDNHNKYFARFADDRAVVRVKAADVDTIATVAADPAILRNRDLVKLRPSEIDAIDLKNASGLIKIRGADNKRKLLVGDAPPRHADITTVGELLSDLRKPRQVQSFPDPAKEKEYGFDKPSATTLALWANGLKKDEKNDAKPEEKKPDDKKPADSGFTLKEPDKPTVKLTFGNEDKDSVYVLREKGGDKTIVTVPKSILAKLNRGPLAFRERIIPSFSESADVSKILIERGGEPYEIDKEDKTWKLKQPKDLAGRTADMSRVNSILAELRGLKPERFEAEGTVDLEKYGLKTPAIKASVKIKGKDDKTEDWVYLFGKETDDKSGVYAKQEKDDIVFVVPNKVVETIRGDLEDPTVVQLDVNKIKELKLTGWRQLTGSANVLQMERKSATSWAAKQPPDFDVKVDAAEKFAAALANLRAHKFVAKKGGPLPEHKLGPKEANLQIEITVEGVDDPITLTIGELNAADKAYFAQISTLPGNVFLLNEEPPAGALSTINWKEVLKSPKYFSK